MDLSVIIAVYNGEPYIKRCLDSILNQEGIKKEIIIINDGSTDNSLEILEKYKEEYNELVILNQKNSGQGVARNNGLKLAKGKYVTFIDIDDYLSNIQVYKRLIDRCENENLDMMIYRYNYVKEGSVIKTSKIEDDNKIYTSEDIINKFLSTSEVEGFCWNKIFKKNILEENKIKFIPNRKYEDIPFVVNSILNCKRIKFDSINAYNYVINNESTTRNIKYQTLIDEIDMIELFIKNIEKIHKDTFKEQIRNYINGRLIVYRKYRIKNLISRKISISEFINIMRKYKKLSKIYS